VPYVGVSIGVSVESIAKKAAEIVGVEIGIGLTAELISVEVTVFVVLGDFFGVACIGGIVWQAPMNKAIKIKMKTFPLFNIMKHSFHKRYRIASRTTDELTRPEPFVSDFVIAQGERSLRVRCLP